MPDVQVVAAWVIIGSFLAPMVGFVLWKLLGGVGGVAQRFERWVERATRTKEQP